MSTIYQLKSITLRSFSATSMKHTMNKPELPPFDVSRSEFPGSERGVSANGRVATSVRRSGRARSGAFAEGIVDDHIIADQDVECFLSARSRHLHGYHVALGMG